MTSAPGAALQLPEIAAAVLEHLEGRSASLYAAMRVCRAWFHAGARILWRRPTARAFRRVAPARRHFYAHFVTTLSPWHSSDQCLAHLPLPALRDLGLQRRAWGWRYAAMLRHIGPRLARLSCDFGADVLHELWARPPRALRGLELNRDWRRADQDSVDGLTLWFAAHPLPQLRRLQLHHTLLTSNRQLERVVQLFAQHEQLQLLHIDGDDDGHPRLSRAALVAVSQMRPPPYQRLHDLRIAIESSAVPLLVGLLPALARLSIVVDDDAHAVLPAVAQLTALRLLVVKLAPEAEVAPDDLLALRKLARLCFFSLRGGRAAAAAAVTDSHHQQLWASLPHLQTLTYWVAGAAAPRLLATIGERCRKLRMLELGGEHCIGSAVQQLHPSAVPLFPALDWLKVGRFNVGAVPPVK
jgi:hypothetical protein